MAVRGCQVGDHVDATTVRSVGASAKDIINSDICMIIALHIFWAPNDMDQVCRRAICLIVRPTGRPAHARIGAIA